MRRRKGRAGRKAAANSSSTQQSPSEAPAAATAKLHAAPAAVEKGSPAISLSRSQAAGTSGTTRKMPLHVKEKAEEEEEEEEVGRNSFLFTRRVFLHLLGLIYFTAFLVAWHQNEGLIGPGGLTPAKTHMANLVRRFLGKSGNSWADNFEGFCQRPTLLWFVPFEQFYSVLDLITIGGLGLSALLMVLGRANGVVLFLLWIFYFSIDTVGQRWYGFGWESQLLETGFLAIFSCPLLQLSSLEASAPLSVVVWGNRWLMFRLMIGAGLIKLRGDQCWRDLTCMDYHYETQPVPSPVSWFLHFNAGWFHKVETMTNHIVECVVPFFVFMPRNWRVACGVIQIGFQIVLIVSGNLSFLNWLSILPSLWCLDDAFFHSIGWVSKHNMMAIVHHGDDDEKTTRGFLAALSRTVRVVTSFSLLIGLTYLSIPVVANLLQLHGRQAMNTNYNNFKLLNTYGAFGSIGKERTELVLQGTRDDIHGSGPIEWMDYEFKCKPGNIDRTPCIITPYHYRLDWLLWFCAFSDYKTYPWLLHLADKLMVNDPLMSSLLAEGGNPFLDGEPPRYVRALHFSYKLSPPEDAKAFFAAVGTKESLQELFSSLRQSFARQVLRMLYVIADAVGIEREPLDLSTSSVSSVQTATPQPASEAGARLVAEGYEVGRWWSRKLLGEYFPAVSRENASLRKFLQSHGWGSE